MDLVERLGDAKRIVRDEVRHRFGKPQVHPDMGTRYQDALATSQPYWSIHAERLTPEELLSCTLDDETIGAVRFNFVFAGGNYTLVHVGNLGEPSYLHLVNKPAKGISFFVAVLDYVRKIAEADMSRRNEDKTGVVPYSKSRVIPVWDHPSKAYDAELARRIAAWHNKAPIVDQVDFYGIGQRPINTGLPEGKLKIEPARQYQPR